MAAKLSVPVVCSGLGAGAPVGLRSRARAAQPRPCLRLSRSGAQGCNAGAARFWVQRHRQCSGMHEVRSHACLICMACMTCRLRM
jgi:hypothetical protein